MILQLELVFIIPLKVTRVVFATSPLKLKEKTVKPLFVEFGLQPKKIISQRNYHKIIEMFLKKGYYLSSIDLQVYML